MQQLTGCGARDIGPAKPAHGRNATAFRPGDLHRFESRSASAPAHQASSAKADILSKVRQ